jgi:hypothetical protein
MLYGYIAAVIIIFAVILFVCHYNRCARISGEMRILQVFDPSDDVIAHVFTANLPIVLEDEMNIWDFGSDDITLLHSDMATVAEIIKDRTVYTCIMHNLGYYALPLCSNWTLKLEHVTAGYTSPIVPIYERHFRHIIGCINGDMRVIVFHPSVDNGILSSSEKLEKELNNIASIEIILHPGFMLYIPYKWAYFIYAGGGVNGESAIILSCINIF